jgi:hypothetical protein
MSPVPTPAGCAVADTSSASFYRVDGGALDTVVVLHGGPGLNLEGLRPDLRPPHRRRNGGPWATI